MRSPARVASSLLFFFVAFSSRDPCQAQIPDAGLRIHVRDVAGGPLPVEALVTISSVSGAGSLTQPASHGGDAVFDHIIGGEYSIHVDAAGYQTGQADIAVAHGEIAETFISLRPVAAAPWASAPGVPLLTGKARKELDAAIQSLKANQLTEAATHVASALKKAPAHPDVQYVAGLCAEAQKNLAAAQQYFQAAIGIYPNHLGAQVALSALLMQQNNAAAALPHVEKALALDPNNWRIQWMAAEAYLSAEHDAAKGKLHASRAIELGGKQAADAEVTLARAEILAGEKDAARTRLQKFVNDYPDHPAAARAKTMLQQLGSAPASPQNN